MLDYYAHLQTVIMLGGYSLADLEGKIDKVWIEGKLTDAQREELRASAAENADDSAQVDVIAKLADLETRVYALEHPTDIYPIWVSGYVTQQHEIVRYDVTGDGEYDLCQYNGGRSYTSLSIGKIEGWHMLDIELNRTHTIMRDASGGYVLAPVEV